LLLKLLESEEVRADIFADGGVRAAACFDGADARGREGFVPGKEFCIFPVLIVSGCWDIIYVVRLGLDWIYVLGFEVCRVPGWCVLSYRVKISFVTAAMLYSSRRARDNASMSAVLPDPTGLFKVQG
jgi:hypothetical protein